MINRSSHPTQIMATIKIAAQAQIIKLMVIMAIATIKMVRAHSAEAILNEEPKEEGEE